MTVRANKVAETCPLHKYFGQDLMISVKEADNIIYSVHYPSSVIRVGLGDALGKTLAEEVKADRDLPPFNRATMDGIAIRSSSFIKGIRKFSIKGTQSAGVPSLHLGDDDQCVEIMTGAVLPAEADAVVRYEDIAIQDGVATISVDDVSAGQHIHHRGKDAARGTVLLSPARRISAAEIALLASVGLTSVQVYQPPAVAIVSTGDELVPIDKNPEPWQVRTSNSHALAAALNTMGIHASMFHLADDNTTIVSNVGQILDEHDVVILSGGVSKGKFDYIPDALEKNGIHKQFHEISQRPGKPLWFGRGNSKTVFALPGNPVSTFMCFHRYVKPWIERSLHTHPPSLTAILRTSFQFKPPLTYFLQVKTTIESGRILAEPDAGGGSGDFANLRNVDGFLELPAEKVDFVAGEAYPYFPFRA